MKRASTATGKALIGKLSKSKKDAFLEVCYELLELFYSDLDIDYELNIIIQGGEDSCNIFYCLATNQDTLQVDDFEKSDMNKIFARFGTIKHLTIIYHKNLIAKEIREVNQKFILNLYSQYAVSSLDSFTPAAFIENIFAKTRDILYQKINETNEKFKSEYQERLSQQKIYIEDVPFVHDSDIAYNPKEYIYDNFIHEQGSTAKAWTFVISEFGFGKTSLLINLPNLNSSYKYIYIPIAQFARNSFSNETELAKSILEIVFNRSMDTKNTEIDKIFVTEFRLLLRFQKDIVLLYDGLDEYHLSYKERGLKQIFTCCTSFVCNAIFTARKEFTDERQGDFTIALKIQPKPKYSYLHLIEWSNREILKYIDALKSSVDTGAESHGYLIEFEILIKRNRYNDIYGDIPKRPLFLKMLCDDIMSGDTKIKNIAELYESYLTRKFTLDREGSVLLAKSFRPLSKSGDMYSVTDYIFELLAKIAWEMVAVDGLSVMLSEHIEEKSILELMQHEYSEIGQIVELLINSVLVPFDKRERRNFKAKFAHKSFQEYFLSYYLIFVILEEKTVNTSALMLRYSKGTMDFCKYMVKNVEGLQEKIDDLFLNINFEIDVNTLLYRLATIEAHRKKEIFLAHHATVKLSEKNEEYDYFISHSSKDKVPFVEELVAELIALGLRVFYDKESINNANNIIWKINEGFVKLKYGVIVVMSPNFIESSWCNEELAIAFSLKIEENKELIPLLLNISYNEIKEKYPILRAIKSIDMSCQHIQSVVLDVYERKKKY